VTPRTNRSSGTPEKLTRAWCGCWWTGKNVAPGTNATLASGSNRSAMNAAASNPSGNVSQVNSPPSGSVQLTRSGNVSAIVPSMRSRLWR
jgi:hypothetical protein